MDNQVKPSTRSQERQEFPNPCAAWDVLHSDSRGPRLELSFEGDPYAWLQLKERALAQGLEPDDILRIALYQFLEGPGKNAAARARYMAHKEWRRTRPVLLIDDAGLRFVPADKIAGDV